MDVLSTKTFLFTYGEKTNERERTWLKYYIYPLFIFLQYIKLMINKSFTLIIFSFFSFFFQLSKRKKISYFLFLYFLFIQIISKKNFSFFNFLSFYFLSLPKRLHQISKMHFKKCTQLRLWYERKIKINRKNICDILNGINSILNNYKNIQTLNFFVCRLLKISNLIEVSSQFLLFNILYVEFELLMF